MAKLGIADARYIAPRHTACRGHRAQHVELAPQLDDDIRCRDGLDVSLAQCRDKARRSFRQHAVQLANDYPLLPQRSSNHAGSRLVRADVGLASEQLSARNSSAREIVRGFHSIQQWHYHAAVQREIARNWCDLTERIALYRHYGEFGAAQLVRGVGRADRNREAPVGICDGYSIGTNRREILAARVQDHVVAGTGQQSPEVAADTAGANDRYSHLKSGDWFRTASKCNDSPAYVRGARMIASRDLFFGGHRASVGNRKCVHPR